MATRRRNPKNKTKKNKRIRKRGGGGLCTQYGQSGYCSCGGMIMQNNWIDPPKTHCICSDCGQYYS